MSDRSSAAVAIGCGALFLLALAFVDAITVDGFGWRLVRHVATVLAIAAALTAMLVRSSPKE